MIRLFNRSQISRSQIVGWFGVIPVNLVDILDKAITYIYSHRDDPQGIPYADTYTYVFNGSQSTSFHPNLNRAFQELISQGYIDHPGNVSTITAKGQLLIESSPKKYRSRPFHYALREKKMITIWKIITVIATIIGSLITWTITYITSKC